MGCCGDRRAMAAGQPARQLASVAVRYVGPGAVAVRGSVSGLRYTFRTPDPQRVDPRDLAGLLRTGRFRRA
jgi:hypothetical protein